MDVGSAPEEDDTWKFTENGDGFSYIRDAPTFHEKEPPTGTLEKKATGEKFTVPQRKSELTGEVVPSNMGILATKIRVAPAHG